MEVGVLRSQTNRGGEPMVIALVVLVVIGAFILGALVIWSIKPHIDLYVDNAAYVKSITHPEMFDENGNILRDDLLYILPAISEEEDEDDD